MKEIYFKQEKPITVTIMGFLILFFLLINYSSSFEFLIMLLISMILLGYRVSYKLTKDYSNYKLLRLFGVTVFKKKLQFIYPDYISLFESGFSKDNNWGSVGALGTKSSSVKYVIRLFDKTGNFTLFKSDNLEITQNKAIELADMLEVELIDKTN